MGLYKSPLFFRSGELYSREQNLDYILKKPALSLLRELQDGVYYSLSKRIQDFSTNFDGVVERRGIFFRNKLSLEERQFYTHHLKYQISEALGESFVQKKGKADILFENQAVISVGLHGYEYFSPYSDLDELAAKQEFVRVHNVFNILGKHVKVIHDSLTRDEPQSLIDFLDS
jgi:hypothetical protein